MSVGGDVIVGGGSGREVKIFVSSPGDVVAERQRLQRVVDRLNGRMGGSVRFRTIRWEENFYRSHSSFQDQIEQAVACDIVVSIFWTRLGTELPPDFTDRLPDGRPYPSGTAYEVLTALEASRSGPLPDVYVFKKNQPALYPANEAEAEAFETQVKRLGAFWKEWFVSAAGHFRAAFNSFGTTDEFESQIEKLLTEWLETKCMLGRAVHWRVEERGSPFRGLLPFEADHADVFFGRSAEIERGFERLVDAAAARVPFLLLLGASGSGKSSLARAGLIPRLMAPGAVAGVDLWRTARFAMGLGEADPLHALAAALLDGAALPELAASPSPTAEAIAAQLALGGETAVALVRWALERAAEQARTSERYDRPVVTRLVLLADQFEGLFAATVSAERRAAFVAALDALVRSGLVWTIATLRSTDYALLQADAALLNLKEEGAALDLVPPDAVALAGMIHGPAAAGGLAFERDASTGRGLDEMLRADALGSGGVADALPLLQFTLQNLFEARVQRDGVPTLTLAAYAALGGIEGAIAAEAERAVSALPKAAQEQLPWLLRQLATAGEQEQAVVLRDMALDDGELAHRAGAAALIEALVGARVMVLATGAGRGRGRLAHEAVLRRWERARAYVESNAHFFRQRAALQAALERWEGDSRSRDSLLRGTPLATAEDLVGTYGAELPRQMRELVGASRRAADRGRRIAYGIAATMAVLLVGALGASVLALLGEQQANEARGKAALSERQAVAERDGALLAQSQYVAQIARRLNEASDHGTALALTLEVLPADLKLPDRPFSRLAEGALLESAMLLREQMVLRGAAGSVWQVAFSPDGALVLAASRDKTARLWDATTGREVAVLQGHGDQVTQATFSRDGARVVTVSYDRTARVWDVATGRQLALLRGHGQRVFHAAFSPDGKTIATAGSDETARLWDGTTGRELAVLRGHSAQVDWVVFSPDGKRVLTASSDKTARLWEVATGQELAVLVGHDGRLYGGAYSSDGTRIVTASEDKTARLWSASTGRELAVLQGHTEAVAAARFSPDGMTVATASSDKTARLWDAWTGAARGELRGHTSFLEGIEFSPDSRRLVSWAWDTTARLWDADTATELAVLRGHEGNVQSAQFSPDGNRVVTGSTDKTVRLWDATHGREAIALTGHGASIISARFSDDGNRVVTASADKTAWLWDVATGRRLTVLSRHAGGVNSARFSADASRVVTASEDKTARVWDAATGRELVVLEGHEGAIWAAAFSPDGSRVATASGDKTARLWDTATGRELAILRGHGRSVSSAAFSPDGTRLVTASGDWTARLWDAGSGRELFILRGHRGPIYSAAFSPDGSRVATASSDTTVRVWDTATGRELAVLPGFAVVFSPDGRRLLSWSSDRKARVWDAATGDELVVLHAHDSAIWAAAFSPDGNLVVMGLADGTARVWETATGRELVVLRGFGEGVDGVAFSPDGRRILTWSMGGTARLWHMRWSGQALIDHACSVLPRPLTYSQREAFFLPRQPKSFRCGRKPID